MDKQDILQLFLEEALERLQDLSTLLLSLEKDPNEPESIQSIFRCAHTLKGNSKTVVNTILDIDPDEITLPHIEQIGELTHALENLIMEARDNGFQLTQYHIDLLFQTEEALEALLSYVESGSENELDVSDLSLQLKNSLNIKGDSFVKKVDEFKESKTNLDSENRQQSVFNFKLIVDADEGFKHAWYSLVYVDIQKYIHNVEFQPTIDELMEGKDFEYAVFSVKDKIETDKVLEIVGGLDYVQSVTYYEDENDLLKDEEKNINVQVEREHKTEYKQEVKQEVKVEDNKETTKLNNAENKSVEKEPEMDVAKKERTIMTDKTIKVAINRIDEVLKHVSNLVILKNKLLNYSTELTDLHSKIIKDIADEISTAVEYLQESVMNIRMTPLDHLFGRFPKDVRNIAKEYNKKVKFEAIGGKTEIDKSLLDKLGDPLMHLIRNSVFHGLESPEERKAAGKDEFGNLTLSAKQEQGMIVITVEDDGKGIDVEKVTKKAIERGIITEDKARMSSEKELVNLIFHPGLSTADSVNSVAGRGVGMDVVRVQIVEEMKGQVVVESERGKGTRTIIRLPLTLAIINAMLTKIGNEVFAFPSSQVESVEEIQMDEIKFVANHEIYVLRGREIPIVRLDNFFKLSPSNSNPNSLNLVITKTGSKTIGVTVDEFIGHEDIVLKNIGRYLGNIPGISGCNVLGNGDISLIVDVNTLMNRI